MSDDYEKDDDAIDFEDEDELAEDEDELAEPILDEDLDEDDEDDEDEDFVSSKQSKRSKKSKENSSKSSSKRKKRRAESGAAYFLDDAAEEDGDEEEEDEEYDEEVEGESKQVDMAFYKRSLAASRPRPTSWMADNDRSVEEIAREIEEKHRNYFLEEEEADEARSDIRQQSNLPTVRDPKLWMVKCRNGKERATVIALMRRFLEKEPTEDKLLIKSTIAPDHLKGYIYIEAEKESHVKSAIKGLRTLQEWTVKLVPIKEMVDVLNVTRKHITLKRGDWVRVKRGVYVGDIAQVYEVDEARGRIVVKIIPRLDLASIKVGQDDPKRKTRMPARFFNSEDIIQAGLKDHLDRRLETGTGEPYYIFEGNKFKDGYLLKSMNIKSLNANNIVPSLEELQRFQDKPSDRGEDDAQELAGLASTLKQRKRTNFVKGDTVTVVEGDLKHLMGVVESVDNNTVTIMPKHEELHDLLSFPVSHLQKYFKRGDHVKVIGGSYEGETGLIIRVEENFVIIFSDLTQQEIKVLSSDIQEASDVATGRIQLGNYELHDLVQINRDTMGVIVKVERDSFKILDNTGNIQSVLLAEMGAKRNFKGTTALDSQHNTISVGDVVRVVDGHHQGRQGTIKHLYRAFAFLHSRDMMENSGIFVVRASHCAILGGKGKQLGGLGRPGGLLSAPMSPARSGMMNNLLKSPARTDESPAMQMYRQAPINRRRKDDTMMNKTVVILTGQWKGYVGIVRDATDSTLRIELHTNSKKVSVPREAVRDKAEGAAPAEFAYPPKTPLWGDNTRTPLREDPTATPLRYVPGTPSRGMATPMRVPGTPVHGTAWDPTMPNTPMRTSTPSWEPEYANNWTPVTPGASNFTPYSPATRSHFDSTPGESSYNPATPGSVYTPLDPRTPMDSTPYSSYGPNTPGTPNPSTPRGPATPAPSDYSDSSDRLQWLYPDVEVTFVDGKFKGSRGYIKDIFNDRGVPHCRVVPEESTNDVISIAADSLEKVTPLNKDNVIIISGDNKGQPAQLIGTEGSDGIVRLWSNSDIKILPLHTLVKHRQKAQR